MQVLQDTLADDLRAIVFNSNELNGRNPDNGDVVRQPMQRSMTERGKHRAHARRSHRYEDEWRQRSKSPAPWNNQLMKDAARNYKALEGVEKTLRWVLGESGIETPLH